MRRRLHHLIKKYLIRMRFSLRQAISLQRTGVRTALAITYRQLFAKSSTAAARSEQVKMNADSPAAAPKTVDQAVRKGAEAVLEKQLPKLTPTEFREYNGLAEHMNHFVRFLSLLCHRPECAVLPCLQHNHFRSQWNTMYNACTANKRPAGTSIRQFLNIGLQFTHQLGMHHGIEEEHVFPVLARKMPEFRKNVHLLKQHKEIHKGMDKLETYLEACRSGEKELRLQEMKAVLDTFGEVLWAHLDDEVRTLGAENMRKYWTVNEMRGLIF